MPREQYFWNSIALVVFAALGVGSFVLVEAYGEYDVRDLGFFDLTVLGLGAFRMVHLLTYDKIFEMVRAAFMDQKGGRLKKAERGWRRLVCEFLQCIWCTGIWSALVVVTVYFLGFWGRFAVLMLAVAGVGSLLQLISKAVAAKSG